MADFFKGLSGGFQSGLQLGQAMRDREERARLREAVGLTPQEVQQRVATPDEIGRARAEAQAMSAQDAEVFGLSPQEQAAYAPQMPVEGQRVGLPRYQLAGQTYDRAPTQQEIQQARYGAMADVIAERDPAVGLRMRRELEVAKRQDEMYPLERQRLEGAIELQNVQTAGARTQGTLTEIQAADALRKQKKQQAFDTGYDEINKQKFEKPEDRTTAILDLIERTQGVEERQRLQASYTTTELNNITLQAKKFDEGYRQSRAKGVIPALEWFDEQNTSFKLERDPKNPFRYIQVNQDGTRSVFADAKSERELGMIIDAKAKPGGFLQLAQYDLDVLKTNAAVAASNATAATQNALGSLYKSGGKSSSPEALVKTAEGLVTKGTYKDVPTAIEALKKGMVRDADNEAWLKAEGGLIEAQATPEEIDKQRVAFFVRRGYAPPIASAAIQAGIDPTTKKPLTKKDVDAYNATYPKSQVDLGSLPWLQTPEREAVRQGLINQIPK